MPDLQRTKKPMDPKRLRTLKIVGFAAAALILIALIIVTTRTPGEAAEGYQPSAYSTI